MIIGSHQSVIVLMIFSCVELVAVLYTAFFGWLQLISINAAMSSMPYAMHLAKHERQRQSGQGGAGCPPPQRNEVPPCAGENPAAYSSKMMTSIWGMYNKYSVHNLKSKNAPPAQSCEFPGISAFASRL